MEQKKIKQNKKFLQRFQGKSNIVTKDGIIGVINRQLLMKKLKLDHANLDLISAENNNNPQKSRMQAKREITGRSDNKSKGSQKNNYEQVQTRTADHANEQISRKIKNKKNDLDVKSKLSKQRKHVKSTPKINHTGNYSQRKGKQTPEEEFRLPKINNTTSHSDKRAIIKVSPSLLSFKNQQKGKEEDTFMKRITSLDKFAINHLELLNKIQERFKKEQVKPTNRPLFAELFKSK